MNIYDNSFVEACIVIYAVKIKDRYIKRYNVIYWFGRLPHYPSLTMDSLKITFKHIKISFPSQLELA